MLKGNDFRVKRIQQLLLEMAKGNFFYSLEPTDANDQTASLIVMLNMVNEEIRASFMHQGFANALNTPQCVVQMSLLLDSHGMVEMANQKACSLLSRLPQDVIGNALSDLLTEDSQRTWAQKFPKLLKREKSDTVYPLEFKTPEGLILAKDCHLSVFHALDGSGQKILLDTVFFSKGEPFDNGMANNAMMMSKGTKQPKMPMSQADIRLIRNVHDMIISNLDKDLPGLKDLALQMGTNEYKLKYGFKQLYGTTIFRFLTQERLRKTKPLIQYSNLTLKEIAHMTGFKSVTHFSRAFKEKYGKSPSDLRT